MSARTEHEKETILETVRMVFDEFDDYEDIRCQAAEDESDFCLSISVKIPDGEQKVCVKVSGRRLFCLTPHSPWQRPFLDATSKFF